jgi:gas vesicle protein
MNDHDTSAIDFGAAFILGALFGAGIIMLVTPRPRRKTAKDVRKRVNKQGKRLKKDARKHLDEASQLAREAGEEWLGEAEDRFGTLSEELSAAVEDGMRSIRKRKRKLFR